MEKICFKCTKLLDITNFYKHKGMSDGHLNKCKSCAKNDVSNKYFENRKDYKNIEKERERGRDKYFRLNYKERKPSNIIKSKAMLKYYEKYPEKRRAKIKMGKLKSKIKGNHLHHWSYNEEHYKDVIELSVYEHSLLHRHIIYDQERKMYRNLSGILLDTKKSHELLLSALLTH